MPGIFCLWTPGEHPDGARAAARLCSLLPVFDHQSARHLEVIPGRLWLGAMINQPDHDASERALKRDGNVVCAIEGHLVRARQQLHVEADLARGDLAAAVLRAYRKLGPACFPALEGQYNLALADLAAGRLLIACGRHAQSPLYVHVDERTGSLLACSRLGPLGACGLVPPRVNEQAVATFLAYGQFLGRDCYLRDVQVLDSATVIECDLATAGCGQWRRYWDFDAIAPSPPDVPLGQHVDDVCDVLRAAADRMLARPGRCIAGLSGGKDSRLVTGLAAQRYPGLKAWTFGTPDATDVVTAAAVCRRLGIEHLVYPLSPELVPVHAAAHVDATDGAASIEFAHGIPRARDLGARADYVLNGYSGECFLREFVIDLKPTHWKPYLAHRLGLGPAAPHPHLERNRDLPGVALFLAARYGQPNALAPYVTVPVAPLRDLVLAELERDAHVPWLLQADRWVLGNRGRRWTMTGIYMDRHFYGDGCLFYDEDLHDRCLAIPAGQRRDQTLFNPVFTTLLPELLPVPCGNTGLVVTASSRQVLAAKLRQRLTNRGRRRPVSIGVRRDAVTRDALGAFYRDLFADSRNLARSFWDGAGLRDQAALYTRGASVLTHELGRCAAVEIFLRRWVDQPALAPVEVTS